MEFDGIWYGLNYSAAKKFNLVNSSNNLPNVPFGPAEKFQTKFRCLPEGSNTEHCSPILRLNPAENRKINTVENKLQQIVSTRPVAQQLT